MKLRPILVVCSLLILAACGSSGGFDSNAEKGYVADGAIVTAGTFFYYRCNSTGWRSDRDA